MHHLIVGLCGPAGDPATGTITLQQMRAYLTANLGEQQRPQVFGQDQPTLFLQGGAPSVASNQLLSPSSPSSPLSPSQPATTATPASSSASIQFRAAFRSGLARGGNATATAQPQPAPAMAQPQPAPAMAQPQPQVMEQVQQATMDQQRQQQYGAVMSQAQQYLQAQKYPEAFNTVEQALQIMPNDPSALLLKSQVLGTGGRTQEALTTIEQLLQRDPNNAAAWSTRAVVLSYMGQYQTALEAIERSQYLEPNNPETYNIKNTIQANLAMLPNKAMDQQQYNQQPQEKARAGAGTFFVALLLQIGGLVMGVIGGVLLTLQISIPGLLLASAGLLTLCANAVRGTHRYGFALLFPPVLVSLITGAIIGAAYKFATTRLIAFLQTHPSALVPLIFLAGWLVVAAVIPLLLAIGGLISGAIAGSRKG